MLFPSPKSIGGNHPWHPWVETVAWEGWDSQGRFITGVDNHKGFRYKNLWIPFRYLLMAVSGNGKADDEHIYQRAYYAAARDLLTG